MNDVDFVLGTPLVCRQIVLLRRIVQTSCRNELHMNRAIFIGNEQKHYCPVNVPSVAVVVDGHNHWVQWLWTMWLFLFIHWYFSQNHAYSYYRQCFLSELQPQNLGHFWPVFPVLKVCVDGHGRRPVTSWANAYTVVNWFSGKLVKLVLPDVRF